MLQEGCVSSATGQPVPPWREHNFNTETHIHASLCKILCFMPRSTFQHPACNWYPLKRVLTSSTRSGLCCAPPLKHPAIGGHKHARTHTLCTRTMTKAAEEALYLPYCVHTDQMSCLGIRGQGTQIVAAPEQQESPLQGSDCFGRFVPQRPAPGLVTQDLRGCAFHLPHERTST